MPNYKENLKRYRERLRAKGLCVDCGKRPPSIGTNNTGKPHVCCATCLQARRDRYHAGAMPPLFREIQRSEKQVN